MNYKKDMMYCRKNMMIPFKDNNKEKRMKECLELIKMQILRDSQLNNRL